MKKEVIVISLGGSLILDKDCNVNLQYIKNLKKVLKNNSKYKFVIVCGGGSIARKYISAISQITKDHKLQSLAGISATKMNARFMSYFFGLEPKKGIPHNKKQIKKYLRKQDIVFCGALEYNPSQTSDGTAAEIAQYFNGEFINLTNVSGLYNKDPTKFKKVKFIPKISWKEFDKIASSLSFKPGQHFILDQSASKIIMNNKTKTLIIGKNTKDLDNYLKGKKFKGTIIKG